jgi:hypothetical protein
MKTLFTIALFLATIQCFSQATEKLTEKISNQICDCVGELDRYDELKSKLDFCHDQVYDKILTQASKDERAILNDVEKLKEINSSLESTIKSSCPSIKSLIQRELESVIEPKSDTKSEKALSAFPTNFNKDDLKSAKVNPGKWDSKIVAFDAAILRLEKSRRNTPYFQMHIGDESAWVISMIDSGFEKVGNRVRLVGYLIPLDKKEDTYEQQFHQDNFHILVFGIVDLKTKQLSYYPGAEQQMKEWINGQIPSGGK